MKKMLAALFVLAGCSAEPVDIGGAGSAPQNTCDCVGAEGPQGERGPAGPQGDEGPRGPAGPQGQQGPAGPMGMTGPQGMPGQTGPSGDDGAAGPPGAQGPQGIPGAPGADGVVNPADVYIVTFSTFGSGTNVGGAANCNPGDIVIGSCGCSVPAAATGSMKSCIQLGNDGAAPTGCDGRFAVTSGTTVTVRATCLAL